MKAARVRANGGPPPLAAAIARASFEHALDPMLLMDDERRCTGANPAAYSLLGLDHESLLSRRLDDFVPVEAQAALDASWPGYLKRGYQSTEMEIVVADGSRRMMEARSTARVLPGCHMSVLRDITDRAAAERARRTGDAYDFLAHVLEHVDEGLHVIDEQRRICFVNPVGAAMLGYESSELVTLPFHETIHHKHPDGSHFPADECPHLAVFETGQSIRGEDWFVRKDGSMLAIAYSAAPIPLPGGRGAVVAFRDLTEHARLQLEREHEREFLDAVLESLDTGVVACGPDGALSLFNGATRDMHGLARGPLSAADWADHYDLFLPDGVTPIGAEEVPLSRALRGERLRDVELVIAAKHGSPRTVLCNAQPIESKDGRALGAVVAVHDVTERRRAEQQLVHHAMHDSLTGLPNRGLLLDRLGHALAVARRDGSTVAVLFADLDRFMLVIESLGHQLADEMIVAVATRWNKTLRGSDTVGRLSADTVACLGGDQFVVLSEGLTSERDAIRIAERMAHALQEPFVVGDEQVFASASIGIALSSENDTPDSLLGDAGAAMERAKERGRGRYELADEAMRTRVGDRLRRENELRRAIEQDELRLHYQPIVSLCDQRVIAAEALVRWEHPERGLLSPIEFIGLAEDCGLIIPLGGWVLHEACRQIARWERSFGERLALPVSINVSTRQLANPQIVEDVKQAVSEAGIDPSHLALEITETVLMEDGDTPVATLEALKRIGTPLVLDDFGTGYSSLSYLGRLPLDVLKLDRSFVAPLGRNGQGREIAAAVVELAHALELTIVAEGVETEDQLDVLRQLGFDLAQGYLFARPLPATEMTELISAAACGEIQLGDGSAPQLTPRR